MAEERTSNVPSDNSSQTRQRKKRKWDQPADSLVSATVVAVPGIVPLVGGAIGSVGGTTIPSPTPLPVGALSVNPLVANVATTTQAPLVQQHANALVQKLNIPKIQDELIIAREIVINDAESSVRYKLTKRQTQEEIQRCTGAVVITRGKYQSPNAPPTANEKPLYLHISAGAHLKDTAERILAVDRAAAMVDEMLKPGQNIQVCSHALGTHVFLGFDPDPSLNIAARVRGPNDQYINHIINETGVNVIIRGRGSGNIENPLVEEGQDQLHLFLSGNDSKSLENAKRLAENLLDTLSVECGVSRVSSSKVCSAVPHPQQVYSAVPPPQQLVAEVQNSGSNVKASTSSAAILTSSAVAVSSTPSVSFAGSSGYTQPLLSATTSYSGYGGIYPQATPLQQVALALRQSSSPMGSATPEALSAEPKKSVSSNSVKEKRPPQKRKFQELPAVSKDAAKPIQGSEIKRQVELSEDLSVRNVSTMPAPKKFVVPTSEIMPPPPPRTMLPPPPKFTSLPSSAATVLKKAKSDSIPDTLVKLMEYGDDDDDEDDDLDENGEERIGSNLGAVAARKPFWAL